MGRPLVLALFAALASSASAWTPVHGARKQLPRMAINDPQAVSRPSAQLSRRQSFSAAVAAAVLGQMDAAPANAMPVDKYVKQLKAYGLPVPDSVPDGFDPSIGFYGKAVPGQVPLLVTFNSPGGWIVVRPNIDVNGEDGTMSTGDYGKGDSASLFVGPPLKPGESLESMSKDYFSDLLLAGVTQKGANLVQNFKLISVKPSTDKTETPYFLVDFKYELLTGAGFEVARRGCGSVTAVGGKGVQAMIGASTTGRFKKTEPLLREVARSFRVYDKVVL